MNLLMLSVVSVISTYVISAIVLALAVAVGVYLYKTRGSGRCGGCSGSCPGCGGSPQSRDHKHD